VNKTMGVLWMQDRDKRAGLRQELSERPQMASFLDQLRARRKNNLPTQQ
jgi:hypothetical protein